MCVHSSSLKKRSQKLKNEAQQCDTGVLRPADLHVWPNNSSQDEACGVTRQEATNWACFSPPVFKPSGSGAVTPDWLKGVRTQLLPILNQESNSLKQLIGILHPHRGILRII